MQWTRYYGAKNDMLGYLFALGLGFRYLTPLMFSYLILIRWRLQWKKRKEGREDGKYLLNFNFILLGLARNIFLNCLRTVVST